MTELRPVRSLLARLPARWQCLLLGHDWQTGRYITFCVRCDQPR